MKKVTIFGHFGFDKNLVNGQTIKTKIITEEIIKCVGGDNVNLVDTAGGAKVLPKMFFKCRSAIKNSRSVVIFPAHNGVKFFVPTLTFFNKKRKVKLFYVVIGGWLPQYVEANKQLKSKLLKLDGIFVETLTMKKALEDQGFNNLYLMPNCKPLTILSKDDVVIEHCEPYKLCTFSRVNRDKGIEDAVNVVEAINKKHGRDVFSLDIYGSVDSGEEEWFESLKNTFSSSVKYKGVVPFDKSVEVLKEYFLLLFPTRYYTEGVPGTIIDAYAAGVPVISSRWESFQDIIVDTVTGVGYDFGNVNDLQNKLECVLDYVQDYLLMRGNCITKAEEFLPEQVVGVLTEKIL